MFHPETMYKLAKLRIEDDLAQAERERRVRLAGSSASAGRIDAVHFHERLARLFGRPGSSLRGAGTSGA
jgi:hypothetical protein